MQYRRVSGIDMFHVIRDCSHERRRYCHSLIQLQFRTLDKQTAGHRMAADGPDVDNDEYDEESEDDEETDWRDDPE